MTSATASLAAALALLAGAASAQAGTLAGTIDTSAAASPTNQSTDGTTFYDAPYAGPFPADPVTVGRFDYAVPAGMAVSGLTVSGDFGSDALGSGTAAVDLYLNGIEVASCGEACVDASQSADVAWSYTFAPGLLASFGGGSAVLTAVQQGASQVVLDPTSVSLVLSTVPEPGAPALMLAALPLLAFGLRRRA